MYIQTDMEVCLISLSVFIEILSQSVSSLIQDKSVLNSIQSIMQRILSIRTLMQIMDRMMIKQCTVPGPPFYHTPWKLRTT